ncbi:MAG: histidine phosphatase family protein [Ardenticatenales bacterium]
MRTLLVMRHAKSSWANAHDADHDRPLNERGRRDAPRMGRWLAGHDLVPDAIVCSSATRAHETALAVAAEMMTDEPIVRAALYGGDAETYVAALRGLGDEVATALIVGHNPTVSLLVGDLTDVDEAMPTAAIAWIELPIDRWAGLGDDVDAALKAVWRPREIEGG